MGDVARGRSRSSMAEDSAEQLLGGRYVEFLQLHLRRLRSAYEHGNRVLFYDQLVTAYLLAFFNPGVRSLRTLSDFTFSPQGQAFLGTTRMCRSTLSDANRLMD